MMKYKDIEEINKNINVYESVDMNNKNNGNRNDFEKEINNIFDEIKKAKIKEINEKIKNVPNNESINEKMMELKLYLFFKSKYTCFIYCRF